MREGGHRRGCSDSHIRAAADSRCSTLDRSHSTRRWALLRIPPEVCALLLRQTIWQPGTLSRAVRRGIVGRCYLEPEGAVFEFVGGLAPVVAVESLVGAAPGFIPDPIRPCSPSIPLWPILLWSIPSP